MNLTHDSKSRNVAAAKRLVRIGLAAALCGIAQIATASTPETTAAHSESKASVLKAINQLSADGAKSRGPCPPYRFVSAPTDDSGMANDRSEGESRRRRCYMYVAADFAHAPSDALSARLERI